MGAKLKRGVVPRPSISSERRDVLENDQRRKQRGLPAPKRNLQPKTGPDLTQTGRFTYPDVAVTYQQIDYGSEAVVQSYVGPLVVKGTLGDAIQRREEAIAANKRATKTGEMGAVVVTWVGLEEWDLANERRNNENGVHGMGVTKSERQHTDQPGATGHQTTPIDPGVLVAFPTLTQPMRQRVPIAA